jgi:hypothetical protein
MQIPRRFVFRGNASAFGGFLFRPNDVVFDVEAASSLQVVGGRSVARLAAHKWDFASFDSGATFAEGLFEEFRDARPEQRVETWSPRDEELHPVTTVWAEVFNLRVGNQIPFIAKHLKGHLTSRSAATTRETSIAVDPKQTAIEGVSIGGHELLVELNFQPFVEHITVAKLLSALEDDRFVKEHGNCFFLESPEMSHWLRRRRLFGTSTIYATIVRKLQWAKDPYPGSSIDHHVLTVPRYGRIYFGEILISPDERRLTMARFDLGSPDGGKAAGAGVHSNGSWSP